MDFNIDFNLVQSQKLLLTPQIRQVLRVLLMNTQELFKYVEEQLELNPVLEVLESEEWHCGDIGPTETELLEWSGEAAYDNVMDEGEENSGPVNDQLVDRSTTRLSLKEHLLLQLHMAAFDERQTLIGEYLIYNIDENGYLTLELTEAARHFHVPVRKIKEVLGRIQSFDPPGIGARDLKECLLIQLRQMEGVSKVTVDIVENYLDDLACNRIPLIARETGLSVERIAGILEFIKTLEPRPGREFYNNGDLKYTVCDIVIKEIEKKYEVLVNEEAYPALKINEYYRKVLNRDTGEETRNYIQNRICSAVWLIKCLEQRKNILRRIGALIVDELPDFFKKGRDFLKPVSIGAAAKSIGLHRTVLAKAIKEKYLQCKWGNFELQRFFR